VLRCVTWRTLTSVFALLRNINFCRFRTFAQFCSHAALKILCRSRRTSSSQARQSTASQSRIWFSGPFTIGVQLALRYRHYDEQPPKAHLPTSARFRVRVQHPVSGRLYEDADGESA
jgi:hypothetical protein